MATLAAPPGLVYRPDFVTKAEETSLLEALSKEAFAAFKFRGFDAKRRVVSYGVHYSFESFKTKPADPIPSYLDFVKTRAATLLAACPEEIGEALLTEYPPGAAIGWHKDVAPFDRIVGISLAGECVMQFRRGTARTSPRFKLLLEPRSAYMIAGEVREEWEHRIAVTPVLRYSITFRTLRPEPKRPSS